MQLARSGVLVKHGLLRVKNSCIITRGDESMWLLPTGASGYCFEMTGGVPESNKVQKMQVLSHTGMSTRPRSSILNARTRVAPLWFVHAFLSLMVKAGV